MVNVFKVHLHPLVKGEVVSRGGDLPGAGQTRLHGEPAALPHGVFFDLFGDGRSWPDYAHLSAKHVEQLGKFIQAGFSQKGAHPGNHPGIFFNLKGRAVGLVELLKLLSKLVGIVDHGSEFIDLEGSSVEPPAFLGCRTPALLK